MLVSAGMTTTCEEDASKSFSNLVFIKSYTAKIWLVGERWNQNDQVKVIKEFLFFSFLLLKLNYHFMNISEILILNYYMLLFAWL